MKSATCDQLNARAAIYDALAGALDRPTQTLPGQLIEAAENGRRSLQSTACSKAVHALSATQPGDFQALEREFTASIRPTDRRPPALYESLHRQGNLMGSTTLEVGEWYSALGMQPAGGELPDHAGVELTFLGALVSTAGDLQSQDQHHLAARLGQEHTRFMRHHAARWLPDLGRDLVADAAPFYAAIGRWLSDFLEEEMSSAHGPRRRRTLQAEIHEPSACNFCTACIARCPTNALAIMEDEHETRLVLWPTRCSGCERCSRACPTHCLGMAAAEADGADGEEIGDPPIEPRVLTQSRRLHCPRCGRPTVSRAEWDQILTQLDMDAKMQRQLSLCVECKTVAQEAGERA